MEIQIKIKRATYVILLFTIGILLLYHLMKPFDLSIIRNLTVMNTAYIIILSIIPIIPYILGLRVLFFGIGYKPAIKPLYLILTSSLAMDYTNPMKLGFPLRAYLYKKVLNIPLSVGTASIGIEIFNQIFLLSIVSIFGIMDIFSEYGIKIPLAVIMTLLLLTCPIIFFKPMKLKKYTEKFPFKNVTNKFLEVGTRCQKGIRKADKKSMLLFSFLLFVTQVLHGIRLFVILAILGIEINPVHCVYIHFISTLIATISMIPMGLGTRDASIVLLLMKLGVPNEIAISVALIERVVITGTSFILGSISASVLGIRLFTESPENSDSNKNPYPSKNPNSSKNQIIKP